MHLFFFYPRKQNTCTFRLPLGAKTENLDVITCFRLVYSAIFHLECEFTIV
jgi:hypothetical protein